MFKTTKEDQEMLQFVVRQGEDLKNAKMNDLVGKFTLNGIPPGPKGREVEVIMRCDVDGLFSCSATVVDSEGVTAKLQTQRECLNLTQETKEEAR